MRKPWVAIGVVGLSSRATQVGHHLRYFVLKINCLLMRDAMADSLSQSGLSYDRLQEILLELRVLVGLPDAIALKATVAANGRDLSFNLLPP